MTSKRRSESSVRAARAVKSAKRTTAEKIDFSDIPELSTAQLRSMRRVGRPPTNGRSKQLIALRLDPRLLSGMRKIAEKIGKGYQVLMHEVLAAYLAKHTA